MKLSLLETIKNEGRKKTYRNIAHNREALLPRNSENPRESGRNLGQSRAQKSAAKQAVRRSNNQWQDQIRDNRVYQTHRQE